MSRGTVQPTSPSLHFDLLLGRDFPSKLFSFFSLEMFRLPFRFPPFPGFPLAGLLGLFFFSSPPCSTLLPLSETFLRANPFSLNPASSSLSVNEERKIFRVRPPHFSPLPHAQRTLPMCLFNWSAFRLSAQCNPLRFSLCAVTVFLVLLGLRCPICIFSF